MAGKKITRKVISPSRKDRHLDEKTGSAESNKEVKVFLPTEEAGKVKRACFFHQSKTEPSYTDTALLRKYLTDRAKIVARAKSGLCSKHQREVGRQIKYARHLALLPFVPKV